MDHKHKKRRLGENLVRYQRSALPEDAKTVDTVSDSDVDTEINSVDGTVQEKTSAKLAKSKVAGSKKMPWTSVEDSRLKSVINGHSEVDADGKTNISLTWGEISSLIPHRTAKQCRERWCYNLDPSIKQGPWTIEEDAILMKAHRDFYNQWAQIAKFLPGRTENAVKTRHKSIMRAKRREWSLNEDKLIYELIRKHGSKWDVIQKYFPNRTANALKTRFSALKKGAHRVTAADVPGSARQIWLNVGLIDDIDINLLKKAEANQKLDRRSDTGVKTEVFSKVESQSNLLQTNVLPTEMVSVNNTASQPQQMQAVFPVFPVTFGVNMNGSSGFQSQGTLQFVTGDNMVDVRMNVAFSSLTEVICSNNQLSGEQKLLMLEKLNEVKSTYSYIRKGTQQK